MSWFKRAPRPKNPPSVPPPRHFSPTAERILEEKKNQVRGFTDDSKKRGNHEHQ